MLEAYHQHVAGISPLPLNAQQTAELCQLTKIRRCQIRI